VVQAGQGLFSTGCGKHLDLFFSEVELQGFSDVLVIVNDEILIGSFIPISP